MSSVQAFFSKRSRMRILVFGSNLALIYAILGVAQVKN